MEKNSDKTNSSIRYAGLEDNFSSFEKSKVAILSVPYDVTASYKKGTRLGPEAILKASTYMELFDEELSQETFKIGIHTMEALNGINSLKPEEMVQKVYDAVSAMVKSGKFPVTLGGEHSVSVGAVKAVKEAYPNTMVLSLDAHYDLKDEFGGSKYSHACVARRISEICPITLVGVRSMAKEEKEFLSTSKIKVFSPYDIIENPNWAKNAIEALGEDVYITIDVDALDPSIMPSTGTPEPGGLGWYMLIEFLHEVAENKNIVGFDIVELCPEPSDHAPDFLVSKLIYRLLGYIFMNKKGRKNA